jgi:ATP-binding cassette subfamily C protein LapB
LAIARALSRKPKAVFMDEPTAMMDHAMEQRLVQNLRFALKDKTCIIITHRSPLLAVVDGIAVMEAGRITKAGNRNDMLKELGHATS